MLQLTPISHNRQLTVTHKQEVTSYTCLRWPTFHHNTVCIFTNTLDLVKIGFLPACTAILHLYSNELLWQISFRNNHISSQRMTLKLNASFTNADLWIIPDQPSTLSSCFTELMSLITKLITFPRHWKAHLSKRWDADTDDKWKRSCLLRIKMGMSCSSEHSLYLPSRWPGFYWLHSLSI